MSTSAVPSTSATQQEIYTNNNVINSPNAKAQRRTAKNRSKRGPAINKYLGSNVGTLPNAKTQR